MKTPQKFKYQYITLFLKLQLICVLIVSLIKINIFVWICLMMFRIIWVCHVKESIWIAYKLVDVSLAGHFLHDSFLVIISGDLNFELEISKCLLGIINLPQTPGKLVVVHRWSVLLFTPPAQKFVDIK